MSSSRMSWWKRLLAWSPLFKKGPICGNYHLFTDRYCYCCMHEHFGNWHGGIYDFNTKKEINYWQCEACGGIKLYEEEVICWKCGKGEMIYKGREKQ